MRNGLPGTAPAPNFARERIRKCIYDLFFLTEGKPVSRARWEIQIS
jgi:hypothetical protein